MQILLANLSDRVDKEDVFKRNLEKRVYTKSVMILELE
jgi:hypothetical protein